ncbi:unnamed protein product, partial [Ixodes pacificus]
NSQGSHQKCHPPTSNDGVGGGDDDDKTATNGDGGVASSDNDGSSTNERALAARQRSVPGPLGCGRSDDPGPTRVSVQLGRPSTGSAAGHRSGPDY